MKQYLIADVKLSRSNVWVARVIRGPNWTLAKSAGGETKQEAFGALNNLLSWQYPKHTFHIEPNRIADKREVGA